MKKENQKMSLRVFILPKQHSETKKKSALYLKNCQKRPWKAQKRVQWPTALPPPIGTNRVIDRSKHTSVGTDNSVEEFNVTDDKKSLFKQMCVSLYKVISHNTAPFPPHPSMFPLDPSWKQSLLSPPPYKLLKVVSVLSTKIPSVIKLPSWYSMYLVSEGQSAPTKPAKSLNGETREF